MEDVASASVPDLQRRVEDLALDRWKEESDKYAGNKRVDDDVSPMMLQKQNEGSVVAEEDEDTEESDDEEDEDTKAFKKKLLEGYYWDGPCTFSGYCTPCIPNEAPRCHRVTNNSFVPCTEIKHENGVCPGCGLPGKVN